MYPLFCYLFRSIGKEHIFLRKVPTLMHVHGQCHWERINSGVFFFWCLQKWISGVFLCDFPTLLVLKYVSPDLPCAQVNVSFASYVMHRQWRVSTWQSWNLFVNKPLELSLSLWCQLFAFSFMCHLLDVIFLMNIRHF